MTIYSYYFTNILASWVRSERLKSLERQGFRLSELVDHLDRSLTQKEAQLEEKARKDMKARDMASNFTPTSEFKHQRKYLK